MKQFTIRQFQTDPTKCLKSGVFQLTRYGKPCATVISERITQQNAKNEAKSKKIEPEITQQTQKKEKIEVEITQKHQENWGQCQNPACRKRGFLVNGTYKEWSETYGEHISKPAWLCEKCDSMFRSVT